MLKGWKIAFILTSLFSAGMTVGPSVAQKSTPDNSASLSSREKRLDAGQEYAKRLLVLMDTDKNGKVSKQEFMNFMSQEFDRLDTSKDGALDVEELTKLSARPYVGK